MRGRVEKLLASRWIALVLIAEAGIAGTSGYFYVGPYRWLAELQLALFGAYVVQITFIGAVLVCALRLMVILHVLERQEFATEASEGDSLRWSAAVAAVTASPRASQAALIGVVFAIMGTSFAVEDLSAGPLTEVDIASLERGETPASRYVHLVGGTLHGDRAQAFGGTHSVD